MMLPITAAALLLGVALSWVLLFPEGQALGRRARDMALCGLSAAGAGVSRGIGGGVSRCANGVLGSARRFQAHWRAHRATWAFAIALVLAPPMLMLALHRPSNGNDVPAPAPPRDLHIARLLHGEQLAPPPPLPPEAFTTREVERVRPQLRGADREWARLDPDFQSRLLRVFETMRTVHGYELVLLEGYRSPERQQQLAALGPHVTNAGMYQSYHQYGLAADVAFVRDGRIVISERDPWAMRGYTLYGETAEAHGLTWGGRWRMRDYGHVELRRPGARRAAAGGNLPPRSGT